MKRLGLIMIVMAVFMFAGGPEWLSPPLAQASGFIDFEDGVDGEPIRSSIPGLQFTTTEGYDWIYGDWRTDLYNGPYPDGNYYSNGDFFAWLGPNQGAGRIDFTEGCATYIQVWVSSANGLNADAYYSDNTLVATASVPPNVDTGQLERLRVDAPAGSCFAYVLFHDTGNYWLIDDLSTDAAEVPATRPPVIILPGLTGSRLDNNDSCLESIYEVWPAPAKMLLDPFDFHLEHLRLAENGRDPASSCDNIFVNRSNEDGTANGAIRTVDILNVSILEFYGPLIDHLEDYGFDVYPYGYDWRLDLRETAGGLDDFVNYVLEETETDQVNIVDHSLGGLLARYYVTSDTTRAAKVEQVISLGTPFLGAPKALKGLRWGDAGGLSLDWIEIGPLYPPRVKDLAKNSPAMYQILPTDHYFDVYGDGYYRVDGQLYDLDQTQSVILSDHNANLALDAENFHTDAMDDWGSTQSDVAFRLIVGSGVESTPGVIHERTIFDWLGYEVVILDIEPINGDGTVPLHSADLKGNGHDYSGGAPIWYTNGLNHTDLIKEPYVMEFISAILATPPSTPVSAATQIYADKYIPRLSVPAIFQGTADYFSEPEYLTNVPPTPPEMGEAPFDLNGGQIAVYGAVALHVYDESGNHTGPIEDGIVELGILGSEYISLENSVFVTVQAGGTYTIEVESEGSEFFDIRIRNIQGSDTNVIQRTVTYASVPIGTESIAELLYNPDTTDPAPDLSLDTNGDGLPDSYVSPTGDVGSDDSYDMVAPAVTIDLDGQIGPDGWYTGDVEVTITAADDQSGVAKVEYSIDFGQSAQEYIEPFTVQSKQVPLIIAHATDYAGNKEGVYAKLGPSTRYVNDAHGNDTTGCQNPAAPCASIMYALSHAEDGDEVWVAEGTYTETLFIDTITTTLRGGYEPTGWTRDISNRSTVIDANGADASAFHITSGANITVEGFTVQGAEHTSSDGGGFFINDSTVSISNTIVQDNTAGNRGGGIWVEGDTASVSLTNSSLLNNAAGSEGGGLASSGTPAIMLDNVEIRGNGALGSGGGLNINAVTITNSQIVSNTAMGDGGGIFANDAYIYNSSINGNAASGTSNIFGGGIAVSNGNLYLGDTIVSNNQSVASTSSGGNGIVASNANVTIVDTHIIDNREGNSAIAMFSSVFTITNSTIVDNSGDGIAGDEVPLSGTMMNVTIAGNADRSIKITADGVSITNSILWNNGNDDIECSGDCTITYSDISSGGTTSNNNISANPLFVDATNGDYRLQASSPVIDAGTAVGAPANDCEGILRDHWPDMGAYEWTGTRSIFLPLTLMNFEP